MVPKLTFRQQIIVASAYVVHEDACQVIVQRAHEVYASWARCVVYKLLTSFGFEVFDELRIKGQVILRHTFAFRKRC